MKKHHDEKGVQTFVLDAREILARTTSFPSTSRGPTQPCRGMVLTYSLFPLSFNEFLVFKGLQPEAGPRSTAQKAHRRNLWEEYLSWGGFPEVVLADRVELKRNLLGSYLTEKRHPC